MNHMQMMNKVNSNNSLQPEITCPLTCEE